MREKLTKRLPVTLSATALILVVFGSASFAGASGVVAHALFANKAGKLTSLAGLNKIPCTRDGRKGVATVGYYSNLNALRASASVPGATIDCVVKDDFEAAGNDTALNATVIDTTSFTSNGATLLGTTIYPAGNDDWYQVTRALHGFRVFSARPEPVMDIYRDGSSVATGVFCWVNPESEPSPSHIWKIRVHSTLPRAYTLTFVGGGNTSFACPT